MAALTEAPKFYSTDANGDPLSGGKVYTYLTGTNTPKATYTNSGGGTPNQNPVILSPSGLANIWLATDALYRFEVYDQNDALIYGPVDSIGASVSYVALSGTSGASLMGFSQAVTYAAGTIGAKLKTVVSVTDAPYNAVGNGVADDTAAIQAALDAADSVYLPAGTYNVSATLNLNDDQRFYGVGTILATTALEVVVQAFGKTNVEVNGITVHGSLSDLPVDLIQLKTCTNSAVRNCNVRYALHEGISLNNSSYDCEVNGNLIQDISSSTGWGIGLFWDVQRCDVHDNRILDCGAYGILLDDGTSGQADNLPCLNNNIHDNLIYTATTLMWGIGIEGSHTNDIHDNVIRTIGTYGIDITSGNSVVVFYANRNLVHDNIISTSTTTVTTGIRLIGGSFNEIYNNKILAGDLGIAVQSVDSTNLVGNVIRDNWLAGFTAAAATNKSAIQIATQYVNPLLISGNTIYSSGKYGIHVQAGANVRVFANRVSNTGKEGIFVQGIFTGITVEYNYVDGASVDSATTYAGIYIESTGSSTSGLVANNRVTDSQGVPTCTVGTQIAGAGAVYSVLQVFGNLALKSTILPIAYSNPTTTYGEVIPQYFTGGAVEPTYIEDHNVWMISATSNVTVASPSVGYRDGNEVQIQVTQDGTGGRTVTFDAGYVTAWSNTGNTLSKVSTITFVASGGLLVQQGAQSPYM